MKPLLIRRHNAASSQSERGVTLILVAVAMIAIVAMAALSIDAVTLYLARTETQTVADTAALTAARVIAISGITGDPSNTTGSWSQICGGVTSPATLAATAVANQNPVAKAGSTVTVTYHTATNSSADCSTLDAAFGVNPAVTVQVQRVNLPTFFSRIWGSTGNTVSATATAEAFNPSNSGNVGNGGPATITPVEPRCVKPWLIPNIDPGVAGTCTTGTCKTFVNQTTGAISNPGILPNGGGVIGESFTIFPDCRRTPSNCTMRDTPPIPNKPAGGAIPNTPNLEYLPAATDNASVAVPSCSASSSLYEHAIEGCDKTTKYECGVQTANVADLSENPGFASRDTGNGVQCLIHQGGGGSGQDTLAGYPPTPTYPFQIQAGSNNPLSISGSVITNSDSIATIPIYDSNPSPAFTNGNPTNVTIIGFLQVFIQSTDNSTHDGNVTVTVLNVAGCGNGTNATGVAVTGSSPVPVRLVQKFP